MAIKLELTALVLAIAAVLAIAWNHLGRSPATRSLPRAEIAANTRPVPAIPGAPSASAPFR